MQNLRLFVVLAIPLGSLLSIQSTVAQSNWEYKTSLYCLFAGIDRTVGVSTVEQYVDAASGDLLKNLDFTMGGKFEAKSSAVTLIADIFYIGLSKDAQVEKTIGNQNYK